MARLRKGVSALPSAPGVSRVQLSTRLYDLASRLTERDRAIVSLLARLRVLTTHQLTEAFFDSHTRAATRLVALWRLGVLARFHPYQPGGGRLPYHYVLGPLGAAVVAADRDQDVEAAARRWRQDHAVAIGHSTHLAHRLGVADVIVALLAHARRHPDAELTCWLTEAEASAWAEGLVRPDAAGEWCEGHRSVTFFMEFDRATETLAHLPEKLDGYTRLEEARGVCGWVLFAFPGPRREANARRALAGADVPVATAVLGDPLRPQDALWLPLGASGPRRRLVDLADVAVPEAARLRGAGGGQQAWRHPWPPDEFHLQAAAKTPGHWS